MRLIIKVSILKCNLEMIRDRAKFQIKKYLEFNAPLSVIKFS